MLQLHQRLKKILQLIVRMSFIFQSIPRFSGTTGDRQQLMSIKVALSRIVQREIEDVPLNLRSHCEGTRGGRAFVVHSICDRATMNFSTKTYFCHFIKSVSKNKKQITLTAEMEYATGRISGARGLLTVAALSSCNAAQLQFPLPEAARIF